MTTPPHIPNERPSAHREAELPGLIRRVVAAVALAVFIVGTMIIAMGPSRSGDIAVVAAEGRRSALADTPEAPTTPRLPIVADHTTTTTAPPPQTVETTPSTTASPTTTRPPAAAPTTAPAPAAAPTTTTPPPPPTTTTSTSVPSPEPVPAPPPPGVPLDEATAHLDPGGADPYARALAAYETAVPAVWRAATPTRLEVRRGWTSLSYPSGTIAVGAKQMDTWRHALYVLAHEWGHQAAFRFGSGNYNGAPPVGFPGRSVVMRAEQFAECVAQTLVGFRWPNPYPRCPDTALAWTANWLANGP